MNQSNQLAEARELEDKLLGIVFQERAEDEPLDWSEVNMLLTKRDKVHRQLSQPDELTDDVKAFLQTAYENTQTLLKLANEVQAVTQKELIKIEKGRKAHQAYY